MDNDLTKALFELCDHELTTRETYLRAPFHYIGSKSKVLNEILPRIPYGEVWVDCCGGSGVVSLNRNASQLEIFNDRYAGVTCFYRCIRNKESMEALTRRLRFIVHSREEFVWCKETWENCTDQIERAARWYYMFRTSFSRKGRCWARSLKSSPPWMRQISNSLKLFPTYHERFKDFQIENLDILDCIKDFDSDQTVFYIDPDYFDSTTGIYRHNVNHIKILDQIEHCHGFVALSGYPNPLYDSKTFWDGRFEFETTTSTVPRVFNKQNHLEDKRFVMNSIGHSKEVLWIKDWK